VFYTSRFYSVDFSSLSFNSWRLARRIPAHAELFIDYGVKYWTSTDDEDAKEKKEIYWR